MKILILFFVALPTLITGFAQTDCINNVSTDYNAPFNDALPSNPDGYRYLNGFDWFPVDEYGYYSQYDLTGMEFAGVDLDNMVNIMNLSMTEYNYITDGPLPLPKNGWELLMLNLGRYPDDVTPVPYDDNDAMPYIVLYNRYSGTIRVFVNFGLDHTVGSGANAMEVSLLFENPGEMSGILRLNQGLDQALNEPSEVVKLTSIAIAPPTANQWASTDFQITYDPCTCYYPSKLRLDFAQIKESTLEIHGRSVSLVNEDLINGDLQVENPEDFLTGFDYSGVSAEGGMVMHKTMLKMMEDYVKQYKKYNDDKVAVGEHNKQVKTNLAILKMGKAVISFITLGVGGDIVPESALQTEMAAELAAADKLGLTPEEVEAAYEGLGVYDTDWFKVVENLKNGVVKADSAGNKLIDNDELFKHVEQIFGKHGKTFIANNFKTKSMPKAPTTPKATFTEMHFAGQIVDFLPIGGIEFYTPGTYGSVGTGSPSLTRVDEYPVYNEVLGLFALMESPKIRISESIPEDQEHGLYNHGVHPWSPSQSKIQMRRYQTWGREYQIRMAEGLKFAINDVPDVRDYNVRAAFNIKAIPKVIGVPASTTINIYHDSVTCVNVTSSNTTIDVDSGYTDIVTRKKPYHDLYEDPFKNHTVYTFNDGQPVTHYRDTVEIETPFIPVDAFMPFVAGMGIRNEFIDHKDHVFYSSAIDEYPYEDQDTLFIFDLENPLIELPDSANPNIHGYKYEFIVELKLIVDIEFETLTAADTANSLTMVLTYPIHEDNIDYQTYDLVDDLTNTDKNFGKYMDTRFFENLNFHGQNVLGCELDGSTYTCKALNNIIIDGDLTTSGGYNVDMIAGNLIEVVNESNISPEIVLEIKSLLDYSSPTPKVDLDYIRNFCQGLDGEAPPYKANISTKMAEKGLDENSEESMDDFDQNDGFTFDLYPNPTTENFYIMIHNSESEVSIEIRDLSGKLVGVNYTNPKKDIYQINSEDYSSGLYFITVMSNGNSHTKRLIIQ